MKMVVATEHDGPDMVMEIVSTTDAAIMLFWLASGVWIIGICIFPWCRGHDGSKRYAYLQIGRLAVSMHPRFS